MNKREIDQTIKKLIKGLVIYNEKAEPFSDKDYWSGTIFQALDTLPTLESFSGKKPKPSRAPKKKVASPLILKTLPTNKMLNKKKKR